MNRYPIWKYAILAVTLAFGLIYTLPNFFGESPAVQVSSGKATIKIDTGMLARVESVLQKAQIKSTGLQFDGNSIKARFADTDTQLKAKDALQKDLNPDASEPVYVVALNLLSASPSWLTSLGALPMYLGLDLRGGVHFLLQVDMKQALTKRLDTTAGDLRTLMREKNVRHAGISRSGDSIEVRFRDEDTRGKARNVILDGQPNLELTDATDGSDLKLVAVFKPAAAKEVLDTALKQNITTLHNRVNELGVAEPVIQQQGADRIVVQLPGVQDTAKAKDILGRTATLEARLVDGTAEAQAALMGSGPVPFGSELFKVGRGAPVVLRKQVIFSGEQLTGAQATFDENQRAAVGIQLNDGAGRVLRDVSRENIKKPMAVVLFERGKGEVLTVATIQAELGSRFQITGMDSPAGANDLALLLRAGALAAPMEIIEERTIGPSLGADNISKGFNSTMYGFIAIAAFMLSYYLLFGLFSTLALAVNLLLLVALLSLLQATLTLPGIAAVALTLGMAIDANVLINERIREELRNGMPPQAAIATGYERAWATILDSNVTTLIAGLALLVFGSGAVRGFAVVHCLGIMTSIFSAVFFSRGIVNLWYGRQKKLGKVSIGQVWKPT
ncbi:MAG: protein translocase subunit SecD [Burkholderiaceae bacterium]|nr:protein translocase subunit SecD [Burkholderiaceae bacterium]MBP6813309.1 protein translocase subunit SecD [Burkholderiaceae bacterium]